MLAVDKSGDFFRRAHLRPGLQPRHDQVLYPLIAHDQPIAAPAPIRAAWRAITRHIDSTIAAAHLGRAA